MKLLPILLLFLTSCSAVWHVNRAIEKDPNIIKPDTITVERTIYGDTGKAQGRDSVIIDNSRVWIKALAAGKIDLSYIVKDVTILDTTDITVVPRTARQERIQGRNERRDRKADLKEKKEDRRMKREDRRTVEAIESTKKVVERQKGWNLLWVGICIGLAISTLGRFLIKRFLANFVG